MDKISYIVAAFFALIILVASGLLLFAFFDTFKAWWKIKWHLIKKFYFETKEKIILLRRIWTQIYKTNNGRTVEMTFHSFLHFYERNYDDLEGWGYVEGVYSKNDLMEMYKWITHTRPFNYEEFNKINYDTLKKRFEYWGSHYEYLKYKIDVDGELKIHPIEAIESEHPESVFTRMMMKLQNDLYDLDTQKAEWILERRKYFNI